MAKRGHHQGSLIEVERGKLYRWQVSAGLDPLTGKRRRLSGTVRGSRRDAQAALTAALRDVDTGIHVGTKSSVAQLIERAMRSLELEATTREDYQRVIDRYIAPDALSSKGVADVRPGDVQAFYACTAARGASAYRIRRCHEILSRCFGLAVSWEWCSRNPVRDVRPPRLPEPDVHPPSPEEVQRLLLACEEGFQVALVVSATTGVRRGELCGLQWQDVDLTAGTLYVRRTVVVTKATGLIVKPTTKTRQRRKIALDPDTVEVLRRWRGAQGVIGLDLARPDAFVFSGEEPWRPNTVTHWFIRAREEAGVECRLHDLRHFVATQLLALGQDVRTVAGRLGHANPAVTLKVYADFLPEKDRQAADALGVILRHHG